MVRHEAVLLPESQDALAKVIVACWQDEAVKARFLADPKAVHAEHGMTVPDQVGIEASEDTDLHINLTIPASPAGDGELSDSELEAVAGGALVTRDAWRVGSCKH